MRNYRGKRKDNGEWVYGAFIQTPEATFIMDYFVVVQKAKNGYPTVYDVVEVIPETVGQQVGQSNIDGKEVYYGDLIEYDKKVYEIKWCEEGMGFYCDDNEWIAHAKLIRRSKVIGNTTDKTEKTGE